MSEFESDEAPNSFNKGERAISAEVIASLVAEKVGTSSSLLNFYVCTMLEGEQMISL